MLSTNRFQVANPLRLARWVSAFMLFPALACGQQLARQALASFPADTQQLAYTNLAELRSSPEYPQIRARLLNRQLRYFQDFLRTAGIDPDKDLDEVILGWRGEASGPAGFFGMAAGRFQPDQVRQFFAKSQLPSRQYAGLDLLAFGSGEDRADLFFTFLDPSLAAFGNLPDLKALLDVRQDSANPLDSNSDYSNWEAELEGTAPQWGILNGKAAVNVAAPWLSGGKATTADLSAFLGPVRAVLYGVEWGGGFTTHLAVVCQDTKTAAALATLVNLLQTAPQQSGTAQDASPLSIFQNVEARQNGSRLELSLSGPVEALDQVLRGGPS